jgi:hypothetical protein
MLRYFAAGLTAAFFLFGVLGPAAAEKRVALVIGNSAYQHAAGASSVEKMMRPLRRLRSSSSSRRGS